MAILGARGALDTAEMKALDDQATAGSNTEDFLELCRVTEGQTGTFADACQFGAACVCVAMRGCAGRNATRRSLQVYASALLLLLVAGPLAKLEKKITIPCVRLHRKRKGKGKGKLMKGQGSQTLTPASRRAEEKQVGHKGTERC